MDTMWALRAAFAMARGYRDAQDAFCARAEAGLWGQVETEAYPEDYRWESLVDVLRGRVKVGGPQVSWMGSKLRRRLRFR